MIVIKYNVAFYIRLSREDGDNTESESVKNQREILNSYINNNDSFFYIDEYVDDGFSGSNFNRPEWLRLMDDVKNKKINTIITKDLSRMGRDYIRMGDYIERIFPENNIRYIAINDDIDTLKETIGLEFLQFKLIFNDYYLKDTSKKIRKVLKAKKESGNFLGSKAVYGYKKDEKDKYHLIIDENVKDNVVLIFKLICNGHSINEVINILKNKKIKNPSSYQKNINRYDWCYRTIEDMITNETYIGNITQGKRKKINYKTNKEIRIKKEDWIIVKNTHEAIVSKRIYNKANDMLKRKKYVRKKDNLLNGIVYCEDCNHKMTIKYSNNKKSKYYCCSNYLSNKKCSSHLIKYEIVNNYVINEMNKNVNNLKQISNQLVYKYINKIIISKNNDIKIIYK